MNKHKKLFFIWEYCKHRNKYYAFNKIKCQTIISDILKQQTGYHLVNSQQTVCNQIKAQIDKLVEKELESAIEVKKDDCKTAIEIFVEQMKIIAQEIKDSIQS